MKERNQYEIQEEEKTGAGAGYPKHGKKRNGKLVEELEKRAKNVELPEEAVEYCKKKDEEFLAGLARLEIPASNASENGRGMKGEMGQE